MPGARVRCVAPVLRLNRRGSMSCSRMKISDGYWKWPGKRPKKISGEGRRKRKRARACDRQAYHHDASGGISGLKVIRLAEASSTFDCRSTHATPKSDARAIQLTALRSVRLLRNCQITRFLELAQTLRGRRAPRAQGMWIEWSRQFGYPGARPIRKIHDTADCRLMSTCHLSSRSSSSPEFS